MDHKRKGKQGRTSPVIEYARSLGDYLVTSEVAKELDISEQFVRKLSRERKTQAPSFKARFGRTHIDLYTKDDVVALREYLDNQKTVYKRDEYPEENDGGTTATEGADEADQGGS